MPKCVYCGEMYDEHRGLTLVTNDGKANHLCSSKCRKNMLMKRRKVRWVSKQKKGKKDIREEIKEQVQEQKEHEEEIKELEKKK